MMGAYSASKAGVEALGNSLRIELKPTGARVGVAYFAEIDTDMTSRGFGTEAAGVLTANLRAFMQVAPLHVAIDALERGIEKRARRVVAPRSAAPLLPLRMAIQPIVDRAVQRNLAKALEIARREHAPLTTPQE
jgi:short-subunit dehydrogenase